MPFNGSGSFSIVNTFVPNTTILSAAVNANFSDIATGLSDCLTRDGQAGMTAAFKAISGALATPSITFTSDLTSGLYLSATGIPGFVSKSLGILLNSAIYQATSVTIQSAGSGYLVGDTITLTGGTAINQAILTVATLSGSGVATATVTYGGNYTTKPTDPVAQGSSDNAGTSATFNVTWAAQFAKSVVTDEAGNLPWQRFGSSSFVSGIMAKANAYDFLASFLTSGSGISISRAATPVITTTLSPVLVPNYLSGLTMSTAGGSGTMSIAAGVANDSTNTTLMAGTALNKTTASWSGGNAGGLDTGSIANTTWYHFYLIERVDTGQTDYTFSLNATTPALPANYTLYRRIGSGKTDASAHWLAFTQSGDTFILAATVVENISAGTSASTWTLAGVPTGVIVTALGRPDIGSAGGTNAVLITALVENDVAATSLADLVQVVTTTVATTNMARLTNTSAQLRIRASSAGISTNYNTYGWIDRRNRDG